MSPQGALGIESYNLGARPGCFWYVRMGASKGHGGLADTLCSKVNKVARLEEYRCGLEDPQVSPGAVFPGSGILGQPTPPHWPFCGSLMKYLWSP